MPVMFRKHRAKARFGGFPRGLAAPPGKRLPAGGKVWPGPESGGRRPFYAAGGAPMTLLSLDDLPTLAIVLGGTVLATVLR
ncbi:MAG: hypothetical protein JSS36_08950, partial [Proteobacteria bacterium]|nr:hypothetical protein [Pseudomonadota bacterium]